jgi:hypothetical protein
VRITGCREVCVMQNAETATETLRARGTRKPAANCTWKPLESRMRCGVLPGGKLEPCESLGET